MYYANIFKYLKKKKINKKKKKKKKILQKKKDCIFALKSIYSLLPFHFVIWQIVYEYIEYIYSLKHIPLTYFRHVP